MRKWCFCVSAALCCVLSGPGWANTKAWLTEEPIYIDEGDLHISLQKDYSRNAKWGTFQANLLNRANSVSVAFHGQCRPFLKLDVLIADTRKVDLDAFLNQQAGSNLPIAEELSAMRKVLGEQCAELKVIRTVFAARHITGGNLHHVGTLTEQSGWQLQDGVVPTAYDQHHRFSFATREFFSVAGVHYDGGCSAEPILTVSPQYANNQEKALAKQPDITNVTMAARDAAVVYHTECPTTQNMRFILDPIPDDYECAAEGDCFLTAERTGDEWVVAMDQLKQREYYNPVPDFNAVTEVLAAGEFRILKDYKSFFAFYFESFVGLYSDHCRGRLKDPVGREIQHWERRYDSTGGLISEREAGPKRRIWVERTYADAFDGYFGSWKGWATMKMLNIMAEKNPNQQVALAGRSVSHAMSFFTSNIGKLDRGIGAGCADPQIQAAYVNMLGFAQGSSPVDAGFSTDKRPYVPPPTNVNSAPAATQLIADRAAALESVKPQAQLDYEAVEQKKREAHQQRIRDDIARRNTHRNTPTQNRRAPAPATLPGNRATEAQTQQAAVLEYTQKLQALNREMVEKISQAKTREAQRAVQQEFQQKQQAMAEELKQLISGN